MTTDEILQALKTALQTTSWIHGDAPHPSVEVGTLALSYLIAMSTSIPLLVKEIERLNKDLDLAAKVINDLSQEPAFEMGVAHATHQFKELVQDHLDKCARSQSRYQAVHNILDEIPTITGPYTHPRALAALRQITALPPYSGTHGPAPGLEKCQEIARKALGEVE